MIGICTADWCQIRLFEPLVGRIVFKPRRVWQGTRLFPSISGGHQYAI